MTEEKEKGLFLKGLRVVDLTRLLPGPFATLLLADMGADVIKVEDPMGGDYARYYPPMVGTSSAFFQSLNRNKRGVTLNLKADEGRALFERLLENADVLLESFRPGVLDRLGVGVESLREKFPELIICSISGYGKTGPKRDQAGHDSNFLALSGLLETNARRGEAPHLPGFQVADIAGGALYGALGIMSALYGRQRTGRGAHLDISMTEGALSLMIPTVARHAAGDRSPRGEGMLSGGVPGYRVYATADDRYLSVAALEPKFWDEFVETIGKPEWKGRSVQLGADGRKIAVELETLLKSRDLAHWVELFADLDVCVEPVLELQEVLESELHRAREVFFSMQGLTHVRTPLTPGQREHTPPPEHGGDNETVYGELGLSEKEIADLGDDGVI